LPIYLDVHNASVGRQIETDTAEPLVPESSHSDLEIATSKLKKYKSQIAAELIQAGGEILL
jgi:hypothetical protein